MSFSLEHAFKRMSVRPSSLCKQCRRTYASNSTTQSPAPQKRQNATAAFADMVQSNQQQSRSTPQPSTPSASAPTSSPSPRSDRGFSLARQAIQTAGRARQEAEQKKMLLDTERGWNRDDLERQMSHRRWKVGEVYAPHDLSGVEMAKWKKMRRRPKPKVDVCDQLGIDPIKEYKNFSIMSEYMSEMGRIRHSNDTNLRPVNQRKMAKAIRRAIGTGILMPGTHRHPEILRMEMTRYTRY